MNTKFQTPIEMNTDSDHVNERFGISQERTKEIDDHTKVEIIKFTTDDYDKIGVTLLLETCCKIATNVNEVVYIGFHVGSVLQKIKCDSCKPLGALINALKGGF